MKARNVHIFGRPCITIQLNGNIAVMSEVSSNHISFVFPVLLYRPTTASILRYREHPKREQWNHRVYIEILFICICTVLYSFILKGSPRRQNLHGPGKQTT